MVPFMKLLLAIRGESLDDLGVRLGYRRATLSIASRFPSTASARLRRSLEEHFDIPWSVLAAPCDRRTAADCLTKSFSRG